ncbi:MAG: anaerobic ribonucleoside-triphosphate reductase activating protein [Paludibacter sp.]|nr:anaerobic ribonucleoside-triphosphate reductase activating protein [Paludibacter sp.]
MLQFLSYNIVFQEVPGEVTLAINISGCPNCCKGCHSPYLQEDKGDELNENVIADLLAKYGNAITCVCFMGGDNDPLAVEQLSRNIRKMTNSRLKTAWYSGKSKLPEHYFAGSFDYIKLGPYNEKLGGLDAPSGNQRFYKVKDGLMEDMTDSFTKRSKA